MENILSYILGAVMILFAGRETFNYFSKKNLKNKLNEVKDNLDMEEIRNEKEKLDNERDNYRKLLDEYNKSDSE